MLKPLFSKLSGFYQRQPLFSLFILGLFACLLQPPFALWPLLPLFLGVLFHAWVSAADPRAALKAVASFHFGFYLTSLHWVTFSALVDLKSYWWFIPLPLLGLPALLTVITLIVFAPFALIMKKTKLMSKIKQFKTLPSISFIGAWLLNEWLRGWLFTGFPWAYVAHSFTGSAMTMQLAVLIGSTGLSLFGLIFALAPWRSDGSLRLRGLFFAALMALGMLGFGAYRLFIIAPPLEPLISVNQSNDSSKASLILIQPNRFQGFVLPNNERVEVLLHSIALSQEALRDAAAQGLSIDAIIWPEAAIPFDLASLPFLRQLLVDDLLTPNKSGAFAKRLIAGGLRLEGKSDEDLRVYNTLQLLGQDAEVSHYYDKRHLVPFGEYMPLRRYLNKIPSLASSFYDTSVGENSALIAAQGLPAFEAKICYEGVFALNPDPRAKLLLNITHDGWFGLTTGPYQHFAIQRLRALEAGLPFVRVSNPGISAFIDQYGRLRGRIPLDTEGYLIGNISTL